MEGRQLPQSGARRRGAADPAPQRLQDRRPDRARPSSDDDDRAACSAVTATTSAFVDGDDPAASTATSPPRSTAAWTRIRAIQDDARAGAARSAARPRWPAIVLRTPKGWTGPEGGRRRAGRGDVPRAPGAARRGARRTPSTWRMLEAWMRSYRPEELFDARRPARRRARRRSRPTGDRRMGANPHANGGRLLRRRSTCPTSTTTRSRCTRPGTRAARVDAPSSARCCATSTSPERGGRELPPLLPRRDQLEPARRRVRGREPLLVEPTSRPRRSRRRPTAG